MLNVSETWGSLLVGQQGHCPLNLKHNSIMGLAAAPLPKFLEKQVYIYIYSRSSGWNGVTYPNTNR